MDKDTKICALKVYLVNQTSIEGTFHVSSRTSSAIRPSDAIRECKDGFLTLTNVIITENGVARQHPSVMVRYDSIVHIELPQSGWAARAPADKGEVRKPGILPLGAAKA